MRFKIIRKVYHFTFTTNQKYGHQTGIMGNLCLQENSMTQKLFPSNYVIFSEIQSIYL